MRAGWIAIIAGSLLLLAGAGSSALLFDQIGNFVVEQWPDASGAVEWTMKVLSWLAGLGGLAVIAGGVLMLLGLEGIGRLVVVIAAIMASVALLAMVIVVFDQGEGSGGWLTDASLWLTAFGVLMAFWARP